MTKFLSSASYRTSPPPAKPAPIRAPTKACVVDTGKPNRVARKLVAAAPKATAAKKSGAATSESATKPRPPKVLSSSPPRKSEATDPARVVAVPHSAACRSDAVPLPYSDATPLKLAFAPFVNATNPMATMSTVSIMGHFAELSFVSTGCCFKFAYSFHDPS